MFKLYESHQNKVLTSAFLGYFLLQNKYLLEHIWVDLYGTI